MNHTIGFRIVESALFGPETTGASGEFARKERSKHDDESEHIPRRRRFDVRMG